MASPTAGAAVTPMPPLPSRGLPSPRCATATSPSGSLGLVRTAMVGVPGQPFGVAVTPDGRWAFVAVGTSIEVFRTAGAPGAPGSLAPALVATVQVPGTPLGETMTRDGRYLLAADGNGAVVISVARAERGGAGAVLGTLAAPASITRKSSVPVSGFDGAIEVAVSPDDRFAFVTLENVHQAAVFNLGKALAQGFGRADYVGGIPLGLAPVGMAVSPDGHWLYATSEAILGAAPGPQTPGTLTVINLRRAETDPAGSVAATVDAGCQPVRVITSAGGSQVWVTARASDDLLCFSAARLTADPHRALVAAVRVGEAPVGLAAVRGGSLMVVADSNRFGVSGASSDLDVVDVAAAFSGRQAVVGHIKAGQFPREMALLPDGTLLVSNYASFQVEAVDVASIPAG